MSHLRSAGLGLVMLATVACVPLGAATTPPSTSTPIAPPTATLTPVTTPGPASAEPTAGTSPAVTPDASLDVSLSDAGVIGRGTLANDTRGHRDGTYEIVGQAADSSECGISFEGDEFITSAFDEDEPDGQIRQMSVSVPIDDVPDADGSQTGITDGGASFDFVSESGFGTTYGGNSTRDNEGSSVINVTRAGEIVTFDFQGTTWDGIPFSGQMVCVDN